MQPAIGMTEVRSRALTGVGSAGGRKRREVFLTIFLHQRLPRQQRAMRGVRKGVAHPQQVAVGGRQILGITCEEHTTSRG